MSARLAELPGEQAVSLLLEGERPTEQGYFRLVESRIRALEHTERAEARREIAFALLTFSTELPNDDPRRPLILEKTVGSLRAALSHDPADPDALTALVFAALQRGDASAARELLRTAWRLAPYVPHRSLERSWLALATRTLETEDDRRAWYRDMRTALQRDPAQLARLLLPLDAEEVAAPAFSDDEDLAYRFRLAMMRAREDALAENGKQ